MTNYTTIIDNIKKHFSNFPRVNNILHNDNPDEDVNYRVYIDIQNDYGNLIPDEIDYDTCAMIICDLELLSDDAVYYFLPRLVKAVFVEDGNELLLRLRLENLKTSSLDTEQFQAILDLIDSLKRYEKEIDIE